MSSNLDSCIQSCSSASLPPPSASACLGTCFSMAGWQPPLSNSTVAWCSVTGASAVVLAALVACVMASTLGIDNTTIQAALQANDPKLRNKAKRVESLRNQSNLLLCSLLVTSTTLHVLTTAIFIEIMGSVVGSIVSGVLLLTFTELLPPGICNNRSLSVASATAWFSWACILVLFPISWPLSGLLALLVSDTDLTECCGSCFGFSGLPTFEPNIIFGSTNPAKHAQDTQHSPSSVTALRGARDQELSARAFRQNQAFPDEQVLTSLTKSNELHVQPL